MVMEMIRRRVFYQRDGLVARRIKLGDIWFVRIGVLLPQRDNRPVFGTQDNGRRGLGSNIHDHQGNDQRTAERKFHGRGMDLSIKAAP